MGHTAELCIACLPLWPFTDCSLLLFLASCFLMLSTLIWLMLPHPSGLSLDAPRFPCTLYPSCNRALTTLPLSSLFVFPPGRAGTMAAVFITDFCSLTWCLALDVYVLKKGREREKDAVLLDAQWSGLDKNKVNNFEFWAWKANITWWCPVCQRHQNQRVWAGAPLVKQWGAFEVCLFVVPLALISGCF